MRKVLLSDEEFLWVQRAVRCFEKVIEIYESIDWDDYEEDVEQALRQTYIRAKKNREANAYTGLIFKNWSKDGQLEQRDIDKAYSKMELLPSLHCFAEAEQRDKEKEQESKPY